MKKTKSIAIENKNWETKVTFKVFSRLISLNDLTNFQEGKVVMSQPLDEEIEICVANKAVAKGSLITKGGQYFLKITEIL